MCRIVKGFAPCEFCYLCVCVCMCVSMLDEGGGLLGVSYHFCVGVAYNLGRCEDHV